jgi:hypothetical protein
MAIGSSAASSFPDAIVLGVNTGGLSFVRSLGRLGVSVTMLDSAPDRPGMRSRFGTPV